MSARDGPMPYADEAVSSGAAREDESGNSRARVPDPRHEQTKRGLRRRGVCNAHRTSAHERVVHHVCT